MFAREIRERTRKEERLYLLLFAFFRVFRGHFFFVTFRVVSVVRGSGFKSR